MRNIPSARLNRAVLIGNLAADPELKYTQGGTAQCRFRIAINRRWRDRHGALQEETTFVPITVWGRRAETCAQYLEKGRLVAVDGRLRIVTYEDSEGTQQKWAEVVAGNVQFLDAPGRGHEQVEIGAGAGAAAAASRETTTTKAAPPSGQDQDQGGEVEVKVDAEELAQAAIKEETQEQEEKAPQEREQEQENEEARKQAEEEQETDEHIPF
ncbi:MAG: single-stranded DNA-binding protein [Anaerolineae bacterium]